MMNENEMLYCLIAFILGYLISRHMGNGFNVGIASNAQAEKCPTIQPGEQQVACCNPNIPNSFCPKYFRNNNEPNNKCLSCGNGNNSCSCPTTCLKYGQRCNNNPGEIQCCSNNCESTSGGGSTCQL